VSLLIERHACHNRPVSSQARRSNSSDSEQKERRDLQLLISNKMSVQPARVCRPSFLITSFSSCVCCINFILYSSWIYNTAWPVQKRGAENHVGDYLYQSARSVKKSTVYPKVCVSTSATNREGRGCIAAVFMRLSDIVATNANGGIVFGYR
jgi:hypothetical protein